MRNMTAASLMKFQSIKTMWFALLLGGLLAIAACAGTDPTLVPTFTATPEPPLTPTTIPITEEPAPTDTTEPTPSTRQSQVATTDSRVAETGPGKIAFTSQRDENPEIYVMNGDGTNLTRLTNNPEQDSWPAWSPDGTRIAFASGRDRNLEIYVMSADGTNLTRLTNNSDSDVEPAWSPGGTKIAYVSTVGEGNSEIYVMDSDGSNPVRLTFNLVREESPTWSPDGTKIAFLSTRQGHQEMFLMNADGSNQVPLMDLQPTGIFRRHSAPAWSPDGSTIAFDYRTDERHEIYVVSPDGTGEARLTKGNGGGGAPAWSPDGSKIVFMSLGDGNLDIYVVNSDGTSPTRLTYDAARDGLPDWAPGTVPVALFTAAIPAPTVRAQATPAPSNSAATPGTLAHGIELVGTALNELAESPTAGVHVYGHYVFVGSQNIGYEAPFPETGIRIVDVSDPANPIPMGRIPLRSLEKFSDHSHGDAVATKIDSPSFKGIVAVVLQGVPESFSVDQYEMPFGVWDVSDPTDPQFLAPLSLGNHFSADSLGDKPNDTKAIYGRYFYAIYSKGLMTNPRDHDNDKDHHLAIVDLSDPKNPVVVGDWQDTKEVRLRGLSVNDLGTRVYLMGQFGKELLVYILDVQNPTNPVELGRFVWPYPFAGSFSPGRPVANANDTLVVFADGSWEQGRTSRLHVLDISDLSAIREISAIDCHPSAPRGCWAHDVFIKENLVFSTWSKGGVQATDISDPVNPVLVGGFFSPNLGAPWLSDVDMFGDYAIVSTVWGPGIYILSLPSAGQTPPLAEKDLNPIIATIPVGDDPQSVGVNLSTNRVYVANQADGTVSVIDGTTNTVIATVAVGGEPMALGVNSTRGRVYVANRNDATVSVIDGATNTVIATVPVGDQPFHVGVNPDTDRVYIANRKAWPATDGTVSVIDGSSNEVIATIPVGAAPQKAGVNPITNLIYVPNAEGGTVSVIDGASNAVVATIPVDDVPIGLGVNPSTNRVYVSHFDDETVSVIDGASNAVIATIPVGDSPVVVTINLNSGHVYAANNNDGTVSVIDGATNLVVATLPVGSKRSNVWIGVSPGTARIYVSKAKDDTVYVIDGALVAPTP